MPKKTAGLGKYNWSFRLTECGLERTKLIIRQIWRIARNKQDGVCLPGAVIQNRFNAPQGTDSSTDVRHDGNIKILVCIRVVSRDYSFNYPGKPQLIDQSLYDRHTMYKQHPLGQPIETGSPPTSQYRTGDSALLWPLQEPARLLPCQIFYVHRLTIAAQTLYSGIFAIGSSASIVSILAGPSEKWNGMNNQPFSI